jgi:peptidoglycan/xylan/chitin deacetylase (PgdA/CDA1 family)
MIGTIQRSRKALGIPEKTVILSFDDGPVPSGQTMGLLDLLESENIRAGFCLVGRRIPGNEAVVRRIHDDGHLIVNHGDWHRMPDRMSDTDFHHDLAAFDRRVAEALSLPEWTSRFFRPPGGRWTGRLTRLLIEGKRSLMPISYFAWDVFPFPFRRQIILAGMLANLRQQKGGLFLIHEAVVPLGGESFPAPARNCRPWITDLIKDFILTAKGEGFKFANPLEVAAGAQEFNGSRSPKS